MGSVTLVDATRCRVRAGSSTLFDYGGTLVDEVRYDPDAGLDAVLAHATTPIDTERLALVRARAARVAREVADRRDEHHVEASREGRAPKPKQLSQPSANSVSTAKGSIRAAAVPSDIGIDGLGWAARSSSIRSPSSRTGWPRTAWASAM